MSSTRPATAPSLEPVEPRAKRLRARDARAFLKSDLARASRAAREQAGVSQRDLAAALDCDNSLIGRSELAEYPHSPSLLHVATSTGEHGAQWARAMVRWVAAQHRLSVLEEPAVVHGDDHAARLSSVVTEATDPARVLAVAQADGRFSLDELEAIEREATEGAQALLELQAWASAEIRKRRER